jgi:hypothetical protein
VPPRPSAIKQVLTREYRKPPAELGRLVRADLAALIAILETLRRG